jgi:hypothetical protein
MFSPLESRVASWRVNKNNTHPKFVARNGLQDIVDDVIESIEDMLPHGSGIDYAWRIVQIEDMTFECSNGFHVMDDSGMYCGRVDFIVFFNAETKEFDVSTDKHDIAAIMKDYETEEEDEGESNAPYLDDLEDCIYQSVEGALDHYTALHAIKYAVNVYPDMVKQELQAQGK